MDEFPSHDPAGSSSFPDLMNDPAFDERERGIEDMDTCRICHGEATEEEPLFYPCKCSGSIKFVHQSCLVEWLAHSQKKHCELCKTPFRFTKLYDPNMPQSLPTPLFLKQALIQSFGTLVTWLRFILVAFVWLGWLPWSMRAIWRALFWLADGRWSSTGPVSHQDGQSAAESVVRAAINATTASSTVLDSVSAASNAIHSATGSPAQQPSDGSFSVGDPMMLALIKKVIPSLFLPALTSNGGQNGSQPNNMTGIPKPRYPSWLSDVKFLMNLTPYPTINNMIIDTLEGQLITLLVVIAFILLFLIREWVVQQQPMANIAEGEREAAVQLIANANRVNEQVPVAQPDRPLGWPNFEPVPARHDVIQEERDETPPRSRAASPAPSWTDSDDGLPVIPRVPGPNFATIAESPPNNRGQVFGQQGLHDLHGGVNAGDPTAFRDILARSNGERDEMLRLIHQEGREEELGWIVAALNPGTQDRNPPELVNPTGQAQLDHNGPEIQPNEENIAQSDRHHLPTQNGTLHTDAEGDNSPPKGFVEQLMNWFWGDIRLANGTGEEAPPDDERIVQDPALEDPFVPVLNRQENQQPDGGLAPGADAGLDGNDIDAIEGDDFEGIMDLIGMQGPIFGLLQNGVFCALLIAFTVAIGIWLPYLWGKIALVLLANPLELIVGVPMTAVSVVADIALDTLIGVVGYVMYWVTILCKILLSPFTTFVPLGDWIPRGKSVTSASLSLIDASTNRLNKVVKAFLVFHDSDIPMFSVVSHQALKLHQARLFNFFQSLFTIAKFALHDFPLRLLTLGVRGAFSFELDLAKLKDSSMLIQQHIGSFIRSVFFSSSGTKLINASTVKAATESVGVDQDLAVWDTKDRIIAISLGYLLATLMGYLYLRVTGLLTGANRGQRLEGIVAEVLLQAGGVLKVILIIGIEMIVFPLYCGTLLDVALLPLFSDATILSRLAFTAASPLTSLFVHWFIGTCYMFHFALFVSMCRKILRTGVLYFIRDPDDPTFHPIRDVLERSITTQLRKIGFSALVYGALVIVCLGGVVWGLDFAFDGVLPIHWSASAPMLEFPVDLLFYNFVMPLVIQAVKPSDGLHDLYNWWFHQCAHFLRLSNFFFPDRHLEEEGHHVHRTWWGFLSGRKGDWVHPVIGPAQQAAAENENRDVYFLRDGRYVRAPASDQVRIPKGNQVFLDVTEDNERVDGRPDLDEGLHGRSSNMFAKVYIPPSFRLRIATFILLIWLFAAATGVGSTIIPLVVGRKVISILISTPVPVNDIYAFSSGLCVVGGLGYLAYYCRVLVRALQDNQWRHLQYPSQLAQLGIDLALDAGRLLYMSVMLVVFMPTMFALLTELYILIPGHTLFGDGQTHVMHVVQDWTLGVLYVQMAIKLILWHPQSWAAAVLNGIFRDGWLRPNVSLATRALVLPLLLFTVTAITLPLSLGGVLRYTALYWVEAPQNIYRYIYPITLLVALAAWTVHLVLRRVAIWRINIRDDVYLIGERLHNFSEKRARDVGVPQRVITR